MEEPQRTERVGIPNRAVSDDLSESVQPTPEHGVFTAFDLRDELQSTLGWTDDELRQLPIVYGSEVKVDGIYFDLDHPERGVFRATDEATINPGCRYVPKRAVPETLWYRLATSMGEDPDEFLSGNAAPSPGAFGQPKPDSINASHGGTGSASLGEGGLEMEEHMKRSERITGG